MSRPKIPFYKLFPAELLTDRYYGKFTTLERGMAMNLLNQQWLENGVLPSDEEELRTIAGATKEEWAESRDKILKWFPKIKGGRANRFMLSEWQNVDVLYQKRVKAGQARAQHMLSTCSAHAEQSKSKSKSKSKRKPTRGDLGEVTSLLASYDGNQYDGKPSAPSSRSTVETALKTALTQESDPMVLARAYILYRKKCLSKKTYFKTAETFFTDGTFLDYLEGAKKVEVLA